MNKIDITTCWCGSSLLELYSENYVRCLSCNTLINSPRYEDKFFDVTDEEQSYYGKNYWLEHQVNDLGLQSIVDRSRTDLSGRCIYWLKVILKYLEPKATTLEVGFGSGGLIALLNALSFNSSGIELSDWVVQYVKDIYRVNVYKNKIEDLDSKPKSYDSIILLDVMEHLPQPLKTIASVSKLIKDNGYVIIQTPCFRNQNLSYNEMIATDDPFLQMMIDQEHLYLYTEDGMKEMLKQFGFEYSYIEPALFPYDMFVVASKKPIITKKLEDIEKLLMKTREGRIIMALLDLYDKQVKTENEAILRLQSNQKLEIWLQESEKDRVARLEAIQTLEKNLIESEEDRAARLDLLNRNDEIIRSIEEDRGERLKSILTLEQNLRLSEVERTTLNNNLRIAEEDRRARLEAIITLEENLRISEDDRKARLNNTIFLEKLLKETQHNLEIEQVQNKKLKEDLETLQNKINKNWFLKRYTSRNKQK
ncbi:class I SAM-dependent methyltransferase [Paenibacillus foliorum]|nr:class I SAM-dependent methyltransferase [Paenibacillus foliorum]